MKKRMLILLAMTFVLSFVPFASAAPIEGITVTLDGQAVVFTEDMGTPFIDANDRTLVPFRVVLEQFGAQVSWDSMNSIAVAAKGDIEVSVPIGKPIIIVKTFEAVTSQSVEEEELEEAVFTAVTTEVQIDTAAVILEGRTYLPIRAVMEAFGCTVSWEAETQTVAIVASNSSGGGWGPARPTFTIEEPANYVTFNSITNNPVYGDERSFARIKEAGALGEQYCNNIELTPGKTYDVFVYYHNNASSTYNGTNFDGPGVARDAYARVEFPAAVNGSAWGNVFIGASNANPARVWNIINFTSDSTVNLAYVSDSAVLHNFTSETDHTIRTFNLSDDLFSENGTPIGFHAMDGILPGCNYYAGYITFQIIATAETTTNTDHDFTVETSVRNDGDTGADSWKNSINSRPGARINFQILYKNTGNETQNDVKIRNVLPEGITLVDGTTYLYNGSNPDGLSVSDRIINDTGINIGNYAPGANAYIRFTAEIASEDSFEYGSNILTNYGQADHPANSVGLTQDTATIIVIKQ